MGLKLSLHSVTSTIKSVTQTVAKTVSKAGGSGSSNKTSSSNKSNTSSKKQTGVSSKSAGSNKPASASNKANTKYVTNAPALYNASGKKTAGTSAGSLNRPAQSYEVQKKALEATRKKSVLTGTTNKSALKPVSIQVPITQKKKDPSEKATSNNRPAKSNTHVKDYTPTASREGAGKPFYHSGTVAKGVKGVASGVAGMLPYAGDVKDAQEVITGKDLIAGKKLTKGERIVTGAAAILPAVSGPMLRTAGKGAKIAAKEAP
ncbi:pre-toxin TG domain-containing protein, partial [[Clostridium] polysaccharolyticum]